MSAVTKFEIFVWICGASVKNEEMRRNNLFEKGIAVVIAGASSTFSL